MFDDWKGCIMFMKLFTKLVRKPAVKTAGSGVKEVRSQWGSAFHLIDSEEWADLVDGVALCGTVEWLRSANSEDVTLAEVLEASGEHFDSWHYCGACVEAMKTLEAS